MNQSFTHKDFIPVSDYSELQELDLYIKTKNPSWLIKNVSYSDDEEIKTEKSKVINDLYKNKYELYSYFQNFSIKKKTLDIRNRYKLIKEKFNYNRGDNNTVEGVAHILDKYNLDRAKKYKINIKKHQVSKEADDVISNSTKFMMAFLDKLKIFRFDNTEIDPDAFDKQVSTKKQYVKHNKTLVQKLYFQINHGVEKFYPDLISFNIPRILKNFPRMKRRELYEIFVQYKTLIKICIGLNKSMTYLKEGLDFDTFFQGIPQMRLEGQELARKIFDTINEKHTGFLIWDEFMKGMLTIKSKNISDKIDLFFRVRLQLFIL